MFTQFIVSKQSKQTVLLFSLDLWHDVKNPRLSYQQRGWVYSVHTRVPVQKIWTQNYSSMWSESNITSLASHEKQVVRVILHNAALPLHMDGSIVLARLS